MKTIGFIYSIAAALAWGLTYTIDQKVLEKVSPITLLLSHALITVIFSIPLFYLEGSTFKSVLYSTKTNFGLILLTALLGAVASFCILSGIKILGASTASIFEIAYPFFVVFLSYLLYRTELATPFYIGAFLIFLGSLIIIRFA